MIIKVQIPIVSNEPEPLALIYNEDRSVHCMFPVTPDLKKVMKRKPKRYFNAHISKGGKLNIDDAVEDQDW